MSTRRRFLLTALIVPTVALTQANPDTIVDSPMNYDRNKIIRAPTSPSFISGTAEIGGERVPLRLEFTTQPQLRPGLDDGKSGGFFERLAAAARAGDDAAAHRLYEELRNCRSSPKTRAEVDARVAKSRKVLEQPGSFAAPGETLDLKGIALGIESTQRLFERCEGVTPEMYPTALELLRASVERGYDDNRLLYAYAIRGTDPREAQAQAELLWQKGYLNALGMLGINSLPHEIAAIAADIALLNPRGSEQLAALEAKTSPSEFEEAAREAARILHNPSCCKY